jgi:FkbM family methyltransferase
VGTIETLRRELRHPDPSQLSYQLAEIVEARCYLQHGIQVREGDAVLDVGANIGVAAAYFATECGAGVVHSFEPVKPIFEQLRENLSHFPACVPHPYGLSSATGNQTITYYPENWALSGTHADPIAERDRAKRIFMNLGADDRNVEEGLRGRFSTAELSADFRTLSETLRSESIDRVDLLKIDVEGAEHDVLAGIEDGDWPSIRQVVAELHVDPAERGAVVGILEGHGFDAIVDQDAICEGTPLRMLYAVRR